MKRRIQMEEALKAAGAGDQLRIINGEIPPFQSRKCLWMMFKPSPVNHTAGPLMPRRVPQLWDWSLNSRLIKMAYFFLFAENLAQNEQKTSNQNSAPQTNIATERERVAGERVERADSPPPTPYGQQQIREPPPPPENKPWGYSGIDLMNTGAAFWQNYSGELRSSAPFILLSQKKLHSTLYLMFCIFFFSTLIPIAVKSTSSGWVLDFCLTYAWRALFPIDLLKKRRSGGDCHRFGRESESFVIFNGSGNKQSDNGASGPALGTQPWWCWELNGC